MPVRLAYCRWVKQTPRFPDGLPGRVPAINKLSPLIDVATFMAFHILITFTSGLHREEPPHRDNQVSLITVRLLALYWF